MMISQDYILSASIPEPNSGCWLWAGCVGDHGYGILSANGKRQRAHRASYEVANGVKLSSGTVVCHRCDMPCCVNPDHLFAGTQADNIRDCIAKGRNNGGLGGAMPHSTKLTEADVISIRASNLTKDQLASVHGVDRRTIQSIRNRKSWRNV